MSTLTVLAVIGGRGALVGFLLPLTIVALVAYGVFELIRSREAPTGAPAGGATPGWTPPPTSSSALAILDERFARGELDAEEYVQRRSLLMPSPVAGTSVPSTAATVPPAPDAGDETDATVVDAATIEQATADEDGPATS